MPRFKLTEEQKTFINRNYKTMSRRKMAQKLNIGVTSINTFMKKNGLKVSKTQSEKFRIAAMTGRTTFTEKEDNFIKDNYLKIPVKTMAKQLNRSGCGISGRLKALGLIIPKKLAEKRKKDGMFRKGQEPPNKGKKQSEYMSAEAIEKIKATRFKKGHIPHNAVPVYEERLYKDTNGREYIMIKLPNRRKLQYKHIWLYEKSNGKTPEGYNVVFKDGDTKNCVLSNLECISNTENMYRNSKHNYPKEIIPSLVLNKQIEHKLNSLQDG